MLRPHPDFKEQQFRIDGGDGDRALLDCKLILRRVEAEWFERKLKGWPGEAWLMESVGKLRPGLLLALTPRLGPIADDIRAQQMTSVVVHGIRFPGYDRALHGPISSIGGMTALRDVRLGW